MKEKRILAIFLAMAAALGLAACDEDGTVSAKETEKRIASVSTRLARRLDLTKDQKAILETSLRNASALLAERGGPGEEEMAEYRAAFGAGGAEWAAAAERFRAERDRNAPEREALRAAVVKEFDPFLTALSPEQRIALFDLLVKRRLED